MAAQNIPDNNQNGNNMVSVPVLPPGFRFCPSDEEIFRYYLVSKNDGPNPDPANHFDHNVIRELDVYAYSPSELSENPFFEYGSGAATRHWYFYTAARGPAERQGRVRPVNDGFWLMKGTGNDAVVGVGGEILGTKSCFVFYMGNSVQNAVGTDWTLHEFALPDHAQASFVLYHLFVKPRTSGNAIRLVTEIHNHAADGQIPAPVNLNQTIYRNSIVNHNHDDGDGAGNFDADFAAPPASSAPRVDYVELNDFCSPLETPF